RRPRPPARSAPLRALPAGPPAAPRRRWRRGRPARDQMGRRPARWRTGASQMLARRIAYQFGRDLPSPAPMPATYQLSHLRTLEAEAIHIIREVAAECERPALLFSGGK